MTIEANTTYRDILRNKLSERCMKNGKYSLRAFARDLELSPQRLSHILSGRHGLSPAAATKVAQHLGLNQEEINFFCMLVQEKHARSGVVKKNAQEKLQELTSQYKNLNLEHFKIISDWYHFAILELTLVDGFKSNPKWIAKALKITEIEVKMAIERLLKLELLTEGKNGALKLTGQFFADPRGTPSSALRQFHKQLMEKAILALEFQKLEERDFSSTILAIDEKDIPRAKDEIKKFRVAFDKKFSAREVKTNVYCLGTQLFSLQK